MDDGISGDMDDARTMTREHRQYPEYSIFFFRLNESMKLVDSETALRGNPPRSDGVDKT